jgi:acyl-CoA thioester hydrolase
MRFFVEKTAKQIKMFIKKIRLRIRYAETDKMGYAYYGNYATYFEVARVEAMREIGISYKKMEDEGIMLPVSEFSVKYFKPAFYDQEIIVSAIIEKMPGIKFQFKYETHDLNGEKLNEASTTLVFVKKSNMKPTKMPAYVNEMLSKIFNDAE